MKISSIIVNIVIDVYHFLWLTYFYNSQDQALMLSQNEIEIIVGKSDKPQTFQQ